MPTEVKVFNKLRIDIGNRDMIAKIRMRADVEWEELHDVERWYRLYEVMDKIRKWDNLKP